MISFKNGERMSNFIFWKVTFHGLGLGVKCLIIEIKKPHFLKLYFVLLNKDALS